ncbi:MAG: transglycosylase domain-containing protein, partial [Hyphomicrobium sp.]
MTQAMRDAARKLLSVSWRRAPTGGETHSSPTVATAARSPTQRALRYALIGAGTLAGVAAVCAGAGYVAIDRLGPPDLGTTQNISTTVLDRRDRLLRAFTTPDGRWRLPVEAEDVDQRYLAMLMAFEDKRFYDHGGVDMRSLAR